MILGRKLAQVVMRTSPECLLDTYHAERHPVAVRALRNTMALVALRRADERSKALGDTVSELLDMDEPRRRLAAEMSGLGIRYDFGEGHPLLGRRMPDLDLVTVSGPLRVFTLLHDAGPVQSKAHPLGREMNPCAYAQRGPKGSARSPRTLAGAAGDLAVGTRARIACGELLPHDYESSHAPSNLPLLLAH